MAVFCCMRSKLFALSMVLSQAGEGGIAHAQFRAILGAHEHALAKLSIKVAKIKALTLIQNVQNKELILNWYMTLSM